MNESDRELLELAAQAAGIELAYMPFSHTRGEGLLRANAELWSPLTDDGDALRLAVKIAYIDVSRHILSAWQESDTHAGRLAYVRRAIVRAAAEIGRAME